MRSTSLRLYFTFAFTRVSTDACDDLPLWRTKSIRHAYRVAGPTYLDCFSAHFKVRRGLLT